MSILGRPVAQGIFLGLLIQWSQVQFPRKLAGGALAALGTGREFYHSTLVPREYCAWSQPTNQPIMSTIYVYSPSVSQSVRSRSSCLRGGRSSAPGLCLPCPAGHKGGQCSLQRLFGRPTLTRAYTPSNGGGCQGSAEGGG